MKDHTAECNWIKSDCEYKKTHKYCPHEEHRCDCNPVKRHKLSQEGRVQILVEEMLKEDPNKFQGFEDWIADVEYYRNKLMDIFEPESVQEEEHNR